MALHRPRRACRTAGDHQSQIRRGRAVPLLRSSSAFPLAPAGITQWHRRASIKGQAIPETPQQGGTMKRRDFLHRTACAAGAAWIHTGVFARRPFALPALSRKFSAADTITLGVKGLSDLLLNGYDHGLRFFDSADSYGSHPHVAEALKHVPRDKVTVLTKTWARDPATARADLDRFRRELGTD